jgi:hypothetical protein
MTSCLASGGREPPDSLTNKGAAPPARQILAHLFAFLFSKEELIGEEEIGAERKEKMRRRVHHRFDRMTDLARCSDNKRDQECRGPRKLNCWNLVPCNCHARIRAANVSHLRDDRDDACCEPSPQERLIRLLIDLRSANGSKACPNGRLDNWNKYLSCDALSAQDYLVRQSSHRRHRAVWRRKEVRRYAPAPKPSAAPA